MAIIANALEACALDTTYYVTPEALNDVADPDANPPYDYIADGGGTWVVPPAEGRFFPTRVNLLTGYHRWRGPYLTFQPGRTQIGNQPYDQGSPLDPWGTPYYFFSPLGLLRGDVGMVILELYGDSFDRYALVSLGRDGVQSGDDLIYSFGPGVSRFLLTSLRGPQVERLGLGLQSLSAVPSQNNPPKPDFRVPVGSAFTIRGVNLGDVQGATRLLWGDIELTNITSWTNREVTVILPPSLRGLAPLHLVRDTQQTNPILLEIADYTAATDWSLFE
jgi:hypothetical protein